MHLVDEKELERIQDSYAKELAAQLVAATISPDKAFAVAHAMAKFTPIVMGQLQALSKDIEQSHSVFQGSRIAKVLELHARDLAAKLAAATVSPDKVFAVAHAMAKFTAIILPALQALSHGIVNGDPHRV